MDDLVVCKLNPELREVWRYSGRVLERKTNSVLVEAFFNRDDMLFHGIILARGDRFIEQYFSDRWYNIFEIHDRSDNHLKGWYCNVSMPADIAENQISYVDLALDLLVFPDGRQLILDEDEFTQLQIDESTRKNARLALDELQQVMAGSYHFPLGVG
jgi:uncharacterized protein